MENIYNMMDRQQLLKRISNISETSNPGWGVMTVREMLVHCKLQLKIALGEIPSVRQGSFIVRSKLGRWMALSSVAWPKGAATPMEMDVTKNLFGSYDVEHHRLELNLYIVRFVEAPNLAPHPFFGRMSKEQWGRLVYKHIDHHLKQFGH